VSTVVLPFVIIGGLATATAAADSTTTETPSTTVDRSQTIAQILASREAPASRSGTRVLAGADRVEAVQTKAERTVHRIRAREARQQARQEARERAQRQRREERQQRREARQWGAPVAGYSITATFGESSSLWSSVHTGVDLNATTGTPVTSVGPGTVTFAGYDGSYGNKIVVRHDDGMETWYCHLSAINVSVGSAVTHEAVIGLVGATGNVTGDHLHLELRPAGGGDPVDPVAGLAASHGVHL